MLSRSIDEIWSRTKCLHGFAVYSLIQFWELLAKRLWLKYLSIASASQRISLSSHTGFLNGFFVGQWRMVLSLMYCQAVLPVLTLFVCTIQFFSLAKLVESRSFRYFYSIIGSSLFVWLGKVGSSWGYLVILFSDFTLLHLNNDELTITARSPKTYAESYKRCWSSCAHSQHSYGQRWSGYRSTIEEHHATASPTKRTIHHTADSIKETIHHFFECCQHCSNRSRRHSSWHN